MKRQNRRLPKTKEEIKQIFCFTNKIDKKIELFLNVMCVSYIIRFKVNRRNNKKLSDTSNTSEIHYSEKINSKLVQQDFFKDKYTYTRILIKGEEIKDRRLKELSPSLNEKQN